jgi:hypothetical protein
MQNSIVVEPELIDRRSAVSEETPGLKEARLLARLMDSAVEIPGLKTRIGLDAVLGLVPGAGDIISSFASLYILQVANRSGVSRITLTRMTFNVLCDWIVGSIPIAGDVFDVFWKSNQKNVQLLLEHTETAAGTHRSKVGDRLFLTSLIAILIIVLVGSAAMTLFLMAWITKWIFAT